MKLETKDWMSKVTKRVIKDFNHMSDQQFFNRYSGSKNTYYKRVIKYGDPYMNSPLSKIGKFISKITYHSKKG